MRLQDAEKGEAIGTALEGEVHGARWKETRIGILEPDRASIGCRERGKIMWSHLRRTKAGLPKKYLNQNANELLAIVHQFLKMQSDFSFPPYFSIANTLAFIPIPIAAPTANDDMNTPNACLPPVMTPSPNPLSDFSVLNHPPPILLPLVWSQPFDHPGNFLPTTTSMSNRLPRPPAMVCRVRRAKRLTEEERFYTLEYDKYVLAFNEARVVCSGCEAMIKLDNRDDVRYYLGLWHRHKRRCRGVKSEIVRYTSIAFFETPFADLMNQTAKMRRSSHGIGMDPMEEASLN